MGLIDKTLGLFFGGGRNVVRDTVEVFRENAESGAVRRRQIQAEAMAQFGAEFSSPKAGWFDRIMDGVNRLPRPMLALGTLGLFVSAMVRPVWFAERMQGIALVPEPLWWLLGIIVSFYFGARHQIKSQDFQRQITRSMAQVPQVVANIDTLRGLQHENMDAATVRADLAPVQKTATPSDNPALADWRRGGS